jgi:hypothetical protein
MSIQYIELTRQELYDQIWKKPLSQVASELGISDVWLAKTCRRHQIPVPYRGFWARRESGQTPPVTRLPTHPEGARNRIVFRKRFFEPPKVPDSSPELTAALQREGDYAPFDSVPERIGRSHSVVAEARAAYTGAYVTRYGHLDRKHVKGVLDLLVSRAQLGRALRLAQGIAAGAERRGYTFHDGDQWHGAGMMVRGQKIDFSIEETSRQLPVEKQAVPPKTIKAALWPNRVEREYQPTGRLALKIQMYNRTAIKTIWRDKADDLVEKHLPEFFGSALRLSFELEVRERERKAEQAKWENERRIQSELQTAAKELEELATKFERHARLTRLVAAMDERKLVMTLPVGNHPSWRDWVTDYLRRNDPLGVPAEDSA